jgi:hypothetical protein
MQAPRRLQEAAVRGDGVKSTCLIDVHGHPDPIHIEPVPRRQGRIRARLAG